MPATAALDYTLADPALWLNGPPLDKFADLRAEAPLSWHEEPATEWFPDGGRGFWSLVRHNDIQLTSRDQDTFTSGQGTEIVDMPREMYRNFGGMLNMGGEEHAKHRAIVSRVFAPRVLTQLTPRITEYARTRVQKAKAMGEFDFVGDIVGDFPAQIVCDLMEVPQEDRDELIRLTGEALAGNGTAESYALALEISGYATDLARRIEANPTGEASIIRRLIDARIDGERLSNEEIGVFVGLILTAGIETTATSIAQGFLALDRAPEQKAAWKADFEGVNPKAVEEIIRLASPVMHFRRTATRDVEMYGQTIKAGDKVVLWYVSGNQDETVFAEPQQLSFSRPGDQAHLSFGGGGPHFCLGAVLARLEITIFFRELFKELPNAAVAGEPRRLHSNFVNGLATLPGTAG